MLWNRERMCSSTPGPLLKLELWRCGVTQGLCASIVSSLRMLSGEHTLTIAFNSLPGQEEVYFDTSFSNPVCVIYSARRGLKHAGEASKHAQKVNIHFRVLFDASRREKRHSQWGGMAKYFKFEPGLDL